MAGEGTDPDGNRLRIGAMTGTPEPGYTYAGGDGDDG